MKRYSLFVLFLSVCLAIGFSAAGCSSKGDLLKEVSGSWQGNKDARMVEIHLAGDAKSMTVNGKSYPVTIDEVDLGAYQVRLKVQNGGAEPELWLLRQIWNDNGSEFKLAFQHSGENEVLVHKGQS